VIERNNGNGSWENIASVTAKGNSNIASDYTYTDTNPSGTVLLYRLKENDRDANFKYSPVVKIAGNNTRVTIESYPNPFNAQVNISVYSSSNQNITLLLTDAKGSAIRTETKTLYTGNNNFTLTALETLSKGMYNLRLFDADKTVLGTQSLLKN
jgi:hypothetical protein